MLTVSEAALLAGSKNLQSEKYLIVCELLVNANNMRVYADSPEVISVKPSRTYELHTTRSWDFLGLNYMYPTELLKKSNFGDGVIIGMVDSGWSFAILLNPAQRNRV